MLCVFLHGGWRRISPRSFMRRRRWCWRQQLSSSPAAMLHGLSCLTWLPKPPQMSCLPSSLPSRSRIITQSAFQIKDHYPRLRQALLAGMQHHFWNLPDDLVLLALADDDTELELKSKTSWLWSSCLFKIGKPDLPVVLMSRELSDLVVHRAGSFGKWLMFPNGRWRSVKEEKPISPLTLSSTL